MPCEWSLRAIATKSAAAQRWIAGRERPELPLDLGETAEHEFCAGGIPAPQDPVESDPIRAGHDLEDGRAAVATSGARGDKILAEHRDVRVRHVRGDASPRHTPLSP